MIEMLTGGKGRREARQGRLAHGTADLLGAEGMGEGTKRPEGGKNEGEGEGKGTQDRLKGEREQIQGSQKIEGSEVMI